MALIAFYRPVSTNLMILCTEHFAFQMIFVLSLDILTTSSERWIQQNVYITNAQRKHYVPSTLSPTKPSNNQTRMFRKRFLLAGRALF